MKNYEYFFFGFTNKIGVKAGKLFLLTLEPSKYSIIINYDVYNYIMNTEYNMNIKVEFLAAGFNMQACIALLF